MADYGADPVWFRNDAGQGVGMIPLSSLSLSTQLGRALKGWATQFDRRMNAAGPWPGAGMWIEEGRVVTEALRCELGPEYDITYFEDRPNAAEEYEAGPSS